MEDGLWYQRALGEPADGLGVNVRGSDHEILIIFGSNNVSIIWLNAFFLSFSADPLSNMMLTFSSKEDAVAFAEKNGKEIKD